MASKNASPKFAITEPPTTTVEAHDAWTQRLHERIVEVTEQRAMLRLQFPSAATLAAIAKADAEIAQLELAIGFGARQRPTLVAKKIRAELELAETEIEPAANARVEAVAAYVEADAAWKIAVEKLQLGQGDEAECQRLYAALGDAEARSINAETRRRLTIAHVADLKRQLAAAEQVVAPANVVPTALTESQLKTLVAKAGILRAPSNIPALSRVLVQMIGSAKFVAIGDPDAMAALRAWQLKAPADGQMTQNVYRLQAAVETAPLGKYDGANDRVVPLYQPVDPAFDSPTLAHGTHQLPPEEPQATDLLASMGVTDDNDASRLVRYGA